MENFISIMTSFAESYWSFLTLFMVGVGVYLTVRHRGIQYRRLKFLFTSTDRYLTAAGDEEIDGQKGGISSIYTFGTALGQMVGAGNILGVSVAIFMGGPGAVFWMWVIATLNMAISVSESTLAQIYKRRSPLEPDKFFGGPAFYIEKGVGNKAMAIVFALSIAFNMVAWNGLQSSWMATYVEVSFQVPKLATGIFLGVLFYAVVFGGIRYIAKVSALMVPIGAGFYILLGSFIIITNYEKVPGTLWIIVQSAFGFGPAVGGVVGSVIRQALTWGARRGVHSNEAGVGTTPSIVAASHAKHPTQEGMVSMLGVFCDTCIICTFTALIILTSGIDTSIDPVSTGFGSGGSLLFEAALSAHLQDYGISQLTSMIMTIVMFFFVFTSLYGGYYVCENNQRYLRDTELTKRFFQIMHLIVIVWFAVEPASVIVQAVDLGTAVSTSLNLLAILYLSNKVIAVVRDYEHQLDTSASVPVYKNKLPLN